jgi:hypothetical protein
MKMVLIETLEGDVTYYDAVSFRDPSNPEN